MTDLATRLQDPTAWVAQAEINDAIALARAQWPQLPLADIQWVPGTDIPGDSATEATFAAHPLIGPEVEGSLNDEIMHLQFVDNPMGTAVRTFWHEIGHAVEWEALEERYPDSVIWAPTNAEWTAPDNSVMRDYWTARGLPGTFQQSLMSGHWGGLGYEEFAEDFAAVMCGSVPATDDRAMPIDRAKMLAFYKSLFPAAAPAPQPAPAPAPAPVPAPVPQPTQTPAPTQGVIPIQPRYCADSTTASDIPDGMAFVAGYIDGGYRWSDADWALHPNSIKVRIAVFATTDDGHVLDVEAGDATPAEAPAWVAMRRAAGVDPTVYTSIGMWPAVRAAFAAAGVAEPHYWIAHYDNDPTPIAGAVAKQYANPTFTGHHYDLSIVPGTWPGVEGEVVDKETALALVDAATVDRLAAAGAADPAFTLPDTVIALKQAINYALGSIAALQANDADEAKRLAAAAAALVKTPA